MTSSRLSIDPSTQLPSIQTFGELSNFLRTAVADEESLQMSDSMGVLASHIEAIVNVLKAPAVGPARADAATMMVDLLTILREHRNLVISLSPAWRGLYEYAAYLSALNNFRVLVGQSLIQRTSPGASGPHGEDFELMAWRTLGEGMLLLDMYEQWRNQEQHESTLGDLDDAPRGARKNLVGPVARLSPQAVRCCRARPVIQSSACIPHVFILRSSGSHAPSGGREFRAYADKTSRISNQPPAPPAVFLCPIQFTPSQKELSR